MAAITMRQVHKSFGQAKVIKGVSLEIVNKEFVVFVGPSGCGKSTLLRLVAGLEDVTSGEMLFDGEVVNELAPAERGIAMVFQSYALYPHMSVYENMAFGLKLAKVGTGGRRRAGAQGRPHPADRAPARAQAQAALRRPAPAGRDRPRDRARPAGVPVRRAALQPRCGAPRADADRDRETAPRPRRHHDLRHPRPGRGDDAGRSDRGPRTPAWSSSSARRSSCIIIRRTCSSPASSARPG